ncbi:hypothetical protein [Pedobacter sp. SYP-B3415]|uniref:WapI family immunity protein n=1 Tax=Pedobacter sp. SYP-B3415 TaxID=2496641 RepID=UPI00101CC34B|nr:hypothetical protein [Pedobacter sp. SYP-B3415]
MILKGDIGKLEIRVLKRSNSETDDYWDGNWLESEIRIDVPGFNTLYGTNLRVDDLQTFYKKLTGLQSGNINEAEFITMEEGLHLHCELVANGLIECKGKANNNTGNSLDFRLQTDLSSLHIFVNELKTILKSYPLVGSLE